MAAQSLLDGVVEILTEDHWVVTVQGGDGGFVLAPADTAGPWPLFGLVPPGTSRVTFVGLFPEHVARDRIRPVAELVTVANFRREIGSFEVDPADGEVRFRTSLDLGDADLTAEQVGHLVRVLLLRNLDGMAAWIEPIGRVAAGEDPGSVLGD